MALDHAYVDGRYLDPNTFITPQDPQIQALATSIISKLGDGDTPASRLREAYNYVALNIRYVTDKEQYGYEEVWAMPDETLKRGLGDCEDLSFLLCSLLQALGVRSRVVFGEWRGTGHAWVEVAVDGVGGILEVTTAQPFTGFADPSDYRGGEGVEVAEDPFLEFLGHIAPGLILFGVGAFLMIDDARDTFKIVSTGRLIPWDPATEGIPHLHHWTIGFLLVILGIMLLAVGVVLWLLKYL